MRERQCTWKRFLKNSEQVLHLTGQLRPVHAVLGLLPIRVDLPLQSGLDVQELGAHGLRVALRGLGLALLATI